MSGDMSKLLLLLRDFVVHHLFNMTLMFGMRFVMFIMLLMVEVV